MPDQEKLVKLRNEAEDRLKVFEEFKDPPSAKEANMLVHELKVYQLELEMQNQELREAQNRLEESRDQYTDLFEYAPLGYFILDNKGISLKCNLTGCGMLGQDRARLIGKIFGLLVAKKSGGIRRFQEFLIKLFKNESSVVDEFQLKRKDGSNFVARLEAVPMKDESGELTQCRLVIIDISDEKKVEHMQTVVEGILYGQELERERIAADLHDSINPLLSIASLTADTLLSDQDSEMEKPDSKLNSIIGLIDNAIVGIKEISRNLSPVILKSFGLDKALDQLCKNVRLSNQLKIVYQSFGMDTRLAPKMEVALYRVSQELISNILKHASATKVNIQLIQHKDSITLMVQDDGIGFDATEDEIKTNGFGLKNIISRIKTLSGQVNIDSTKGQGTVVTIDVPK